MLPPTARSLLVRVLTTFRQLFGPVIYEHRLRIATPVLVYQMGKVGSNSIYESLVHKFPGVVLKSHTFSSEDNRWQIRRLYACSIRQKRPLSIISLTREPIGRNVSAFFENFKRVTGVEYENSTLSIDELRSIFLSKYPHVLPLEWFDINILKTFEIDVYEKPFPDSGTCTFSTGNIRLLVMRSEIDDEKKELAIKNFLGLSDFRLIRKNISTDKKYSHTYQKFMANVTFPDDYIAAMLKSKYCMHFYSQSLIAAMTNRWRYKKGLNCNPPGE